MLLLTRPGYYLHEYFDCFKILLPQIDTLNWIFFPWMFLPITHIGKEHFYNKKLNKKKIDTK